MHLSVPEVVGLYELSVLHFQMEVDLCIDKLDCVKRGLYHGLFNEQTYVV